MTHICIGDPGWTAPSHYLNQCWNIVNWTLMNKLQWILTIIHTYSFKKIHLKMSSAKWQSFCHRIAQYPICHLTSFAWRHHSGQSRVYAKLSIARETSWKLCLNLSKLCPVMDVSSADIIITKFASISLNCCHKRQLTFQVFSTRYSQPKVKVVKHLFTSLTSNMYYRHVLTIYICLSKIISFSWGVAIILREDGCMRVKVFGFYKAKMYPFINYLRGHHTLIRHKMLLAVTLYNIR